MPFIMFIMKILFNFQMTLPEWLRIKIRLLWTCGLSSLTMFLSILLWNKLQLRQAQFVDCSEECKSLHDFGQDQSQIKEISN